MAELVVYNTNFDHLTFVLSSISQSSTLLMLNDYPNSHLDLRESLISTMNVVLIGLGKLTL